MPLTRARALPLLEYVYQHFLHAECHADKLLLLLGDSGMGKSLCLAEVARHLLDTPEESWLPVRLELNQVPQPRHSYVCVATLLSVIVYRDTCMCVWPLC